MNLVGHAHPKDWYEYDVRGSVELLGAYIADIEKQVTKGIADYKRGTTTIVVDDEYGEEGVRAVRLHKGLDDSTWHFPAVFEEYFPNLQRRAALITLYSFFEYEIEKLCGHLKEEEKLRLKISDMADTGLKRCISYLDKVAGISMGLDSHLWEKIQDIRRIRNLVVHTGGKLLDDAAVPKKNEVQTVARSAFLGGDRELTIAEGYLAEVLNTFDKYFQMIDKEIKAKYSGNLINRL